MTSLIGSMLNEASDYFGSGDYFGGDLYHIASCSDECSVYMMLVGSCVPGGSGIFEVNVDPDTGKVSIIDKDKFVQGSTCDPCVDVILGPSSLTVEYSGNQNGDPTFVSSIVDGVCEGERGSVKKELFKDGVSVGFVEWTTNPNDVTSVPDVNTLPSYANVSATSNTSINGVLDKLTTPINPPTGADLPFSANYEWVTTVDYGSCGNLLTDSDQKTYELYLYAFGTNGVNICTNSVSTIIVNPTIETYNANVTVGSYPIEMGVTLPYTSTNDRSAIAATPQEINRDFTYTSGNFAGEEFEFIETHQCVNGGDGRILSQTSGFSGSILSLEFTVITNINLDGDSEGTNGLVNQVYGSSIDNGSDSYTACPGANNKRKADIQSISVNGQLSQRTIGVYFNCY